MKNMVEKMGWLATDKQQLQCASAGVPALAFGTWPALSPSPSTSRRCHVAKALRSAHHVARAVNGAVKMLWPCNAEIISDS
jgi:hypothetical protein